MQAISILDSVFLDMKTDFCRSLINKSPSFQLWDYLALNSTLMPLQNCCMPCVKSVVVNLG